MTVYGRFIYNSQKIKGFLKGINPKDKKHWWIYCEANEAYASGLLSAYMGAFPGSGRYSGNVFTFSYIFVRCAKVSLLLLFN